MFLCGDLPSRQDVAKEDFLDIGGVDALSPLDSRYNPKSVMIQHAS